MRSVELLADAYRPILSLAEHIAEPQGWAPSLLPGWTVRDLLFHLACDCQRALVALATPGRQPPDTDEVTYWSAWTPGTEAAQAGLRGTRIMASAWSSVRGPADLYLETARAVLRDHADSPLAVCCHDPANPVFLERQETLASLLMRPAERELLVAWGAPCSHDYEAVELPATTRT